MYAKPALVPLDLEGAQAGCCTPSIVIYVRPVYLSDCNSPVLALISNLT